MTGNQTSSAREAVLHELLAAIKANIPVAGGFGRCRAEPSFQGRWLVMDKDCAERVRGAAAALSQLVTKDRGTPEGMGRPSSDAERSAGEALVQELLAAIDANKPFATGTGRCPDVPCFDIHDSLAESSRPGWEIVYEDAAERIKKAAAALSEALQDGL